MVLKEEKLNHHLIPKLLTDGSKTCVILSTEKLNEIIKESNNAFTFTKLNEKIISDHWGFVFEMNEFMFEPFNRKVVQLVESGIAERFVTVGNATKFEKKVEPPAITLNMLSVWFKLWAILMGLALFVFLVELASGIAKEVFERKIFFKMG